MVRFVNLGLNFSFACWSTACVCLFCSLCNNLSLATHLQEVHLVGRFDIPTMDPAKIVISLISFLARGGGPCIVLSLLYVWCNRRLARFRRLFHNYHGYKCHVRRGRCTHPCTDRCCPSASPNRCSAKRRLGTNRIYFYKSCKVFRMYDHFQSHNRTCRNYKRFSNRLVCLMDFSNMLMIYPAVSFAVAWYISCASGLYGRVFSMPISHQSCWRTKNFTEFIKFFRCFHYVRPPHCGALRKFWSRFFFAVFFGDFWCKFKSTIITHRINRRKNIGGTIVHDRGWLWGLRGGSSW